MKEDIKIYNQTKKGKTLLIISIFLIIIIAVVGYNVYKRKTTSENIYKTAITNMFNYAKSNIKSTYNTANVDFKLAIEMNTNDSSTNDLLDIINNIDLSGNYQMDLKNKILSMSINSKYKNNTLLDFDIYGEDSNGYIYLKDLYPTYISVPIDEYDSIFKSINNNDEILNILNTLETAIINSLKDEYFTRTSEDNLTKTTLLLNKNNVEEMRLSIITELKNNSEFIKDVAKLSNTDEDEIIMKLDQLLEQEVEEFTTNVSIYTKGINFVKMSLTEESNELIVIKDKDTYTITFTNNGEKTSEGSVTITKSGNENTYKFYLNDFQSETDITLDISINTELNKTIEKKDVTNSISIEDMTEDEMMSILSNLSNNQGFIDIYTKISSLITY